MIQPLIDTKESNKLIVQFLGWGVDGDMAVHPKTGHRYHIEIIGAYHMNWDALIGVLQKIKAYMPPMDDEELHERLMNEHGAIWETFWQVLPTLNIEIVYAHVIGFVKWWQLHQPPAQN